MVVPVNVPRAPGVPNVLFATGAGNILVRLFSDALAIFQGSGSRQPWGIFSGGAPVIVADSVITVSYRQQWSISDYPIEKGAFAGYDKVQTPYEARLRFATGGSQGEKQAMLSSIASIAGDLNLYTVVTPEAVYPNVNITHYDYDRRAESGLGLLQVDVWALEVRQVGTGGLSNTVDPTSSSQVNDGAVQTTTPTTKQFNLRNHIAGGHVTE